MHSGATEGISFPAAVLQRVTVYRTRCAVVTLVGVGGGGDKSSEEGHHEKCWRLGGVGLGESFSQGR